jgi:hypothetical protein
MKGPDVQGVQTHTATQDLSLNRRRVDLAQTVELMRGYETGDARRRVPLKRSPAQAKGN